MSLSSILAKFDVLEKRIEQISTYASAAPVQQVDSTAQYGELSNRLANLEAALSSLTVSKQNEIDLMIKRLEELEVKLLHTDLPGKVQNLEGIVSNFPGLANDVLNLAQRLQHLENITMPHVVSRIETLEQKVASTSA
jgi:hypothetical protein